MVEVRIVPAICPRCGADLKIPESLTRAHCLYCGAEVLIGGIQSPQKVKCRACDGLGRFDLCSKCRGKGNCRWLKTVESTSFGRATTVKARCSNGSCSLCGGTGRVEVGFIKKTSCPACSGTGKCPRCGGTGKCRSCHGLGMIPNPTGSVKCSLCGGLGIVDSEKVAPPRLSKCPTCEAKWPQGGEFCQKCGHPAVCPRCGIPWAPNAKFCSHCGHKIARAPGQSLSLSPTQSSVSPRSLLVRCPTCGAENVSDASVCLNCRTILARVL